MSIWKQTCYNEKDVAIFIKTMSSEYTPWKIIPMQIRKFPAILDIEKDVSRDKTLKIIRAK